MEKEGRFNYKSLISTHYAHFYLLSCCHDQSSYFIAYTLLCLLNHKIDAKYVIITPQTKNIKN